MSMDRPVVDIICKQSFIVEPHRRQFVHKVLVVGLHECLECHFPVLVCCEYAQLLPEQEDHPLADHTVQLAFNPEFFLEFIS